MSKSLRLHGLQFCQAPLSMGFPRQENWSGLPFPSPVDLPDPGTEPTSALADGFFIAEPPVKSLCFHKVTLKPKLTITHTSSFFFLSFFLSPHLLTHTHTHTHTYKHIYLLNPTHCFKQEIKLKSRNNDNNNNKTTRKFLFLCFWQ